MLNVFPRKTVENEKPLLKNGKRAQKSKRCHISNNNRTKKKKGGDGAKNVFCVCINN